MIIDLSKWNGKIDWNKLAPNLDFVILKATGGEVDPRFAENAAACNERHIPFHVYHFMYATNTQKAEYEATLFWQTAHHYNPISYIVDVEGDALNNSNVLANTNAFIAKQRSLGAQRIGLYTGDWAWNNLGFGKDMADWIWIARYGANTGNVPATQPSKDCDLWQYTSNGSAPGVSTRVDVSKIQGDKPMSYFTNGDGVMVGSARIDENGGAHGGQAGDQTGKEVSTQLWYKHDKKWRVFRAKDPVAANKIAEDMQWACDNKHIGYDQYQRSTLYEVAEPLGFNCSKVETDCETDCSALVRVCCAYAGIMLPDFNTEGEPRVLLESGAFEELTGKQYTDYPDLLKRGDILVTSVKGHTVVVLNDGGGLPVLRRGSKSVFVKMMQELLIQHNYSVGPDGADGDFGKNTETGLIAYQRANGLTADGVCGKATWVSLMAEEKTYTVTICGLSKKEVNEITERWANCEVTEE